MEISTRPGRKRSEDSRQAILTAAIDVVNEAGYSALSIEAIAKRAGTGKQTIYRWWPSKADVIMEALVSRADLKVGATDRGNLTEDLRALLRSSFGIVDHPQMRSLLGVLMAEAQQDEAFGRRFREDFLDRRRRALGRILVRARDRGEFTPRAPLATIIDTFYGALWYRIVAMPGPLDDSFADQLITLIV